MRAYRITRSALSEIKEIVNYIAVDNDAAAVRAREAIFAAFDRLAARPEIGHRRPDITGDPVRFLTVMGRYLVVYRAEGPVVEIIHVFGRGRDVASLLR